MPAALFRCDASPELGIGHVVRCRALATALDALGWRCAFAVTRETAAFVGAHRVFVVPPGPDGASAVAAAGDAGKFDSLIIDHYGLDAAFETAARGAAGVVVVIDDLANRLHRCDVLLDSNPGRTAADYAGLVAGETRLLLGLKHALLRPEFAARRRVQVRPPRRRVENLLIVLGGSDPNRASERVLEALPRFAGTAMQITLVIGPANARRDTLAREARSLGARAVTDPPDLADLMANADLAITSGSTSCLELACLGIPAVILVTAENQRALARALSNAGAGLLPGDCDNPDPEQIAAAVAAVAGDEALRARMSGAGPDLIDGQGARRAAGFIASMLSVKQREVLS